MKEKNADGFTLVELITVMAIVAILAMFAIPSMVEALPNFRLKSAANELRASLQQARGLAVRENRDVQFVLDADAKGFSFTANKGSADARTYQVKFSDYGTAGYGLGKGTTEVTKDWDGVASAQVALPHTITFTSRGTANSVRIYLDNGLAEEKKNNLCYAVTVLATGFVRVHKYVPCAAEDKTTCWLE